jgi:hypothetical protein
MVTLLEHNRKEGKIQAEHLENILNDSFVGYDQLRFVINIFRSYCKCNFQFRLAREKWESDPENDSNRFQYALFLSTSIDSSDKRESLLHFEYLSNLTKYSRDSLYHSAIAKYLLEDYEGARLISEDLYRREPDNNQVFILVNGFFFISSNTLGQKSSLSHFLSS